MTSAHEDAFEWARVLRLAQAEVQRLQQGLPAPLRAHAETLPVCYSERPSPGQLADGLEPDLLGLFVGLPYPDSESGAMDLPPQIHLFLHNLWRFCHEENFDLREEIGTTYLHELGHYLGLDEDDLFDRDLD